MCRLSHQLVSHLLKTFSKFYVPILFVLLLIAASSISTFIAAHAQGAAATTGVPLSVSARLSCCGQNGEQDTPHFLAASYYSVGNNLKATLMLNNKGPEPVEVKPTLWTLKGERLEAAPIVVQGESFRNVDLRELGALQGTAFEEGSLHLFHRGPELVIGAQLYLVDEARSLSFDEKLVEYKNAASTQLESVWWLPSREATVRVILSNTSELELTASAVVNAGTPHPETVEVTLAPHETRIINVEREKPGKGAKLRDEVGSASIRYTGPKGSLVARALIEDGATGYSLSAQFYSPEGGKSSGYQGVGLRLGKVAEQELSPVVVARNVGSETTYLTGRMPYTTTDGETGVVELPKVRLAAGEADRVDVARVIRTQTHSKTIEAASLEFDYTTRPGSVMMAAQSVSADGNQVFRVPMWDVPAQRNGTGGYPWFIEGDSSTFVYIKNVTNKEQKYTFSLTYEGGDYSTGLKSIKAGQTAVFDLRKLRDNQVPDERGVTIPLTAERGKIVWSVRGPEPLALLGRSEQMDAAKGVSSSYACFMCCPNNFWRAWIEPGSINLFLGGTSGGIRSKEQDRTCYGAPAPAFYMGDTWEVDNPPVASVDGFESEADLTGVSTGTANVTASWEVFSYERVYNYEQGYQECIYYSTLAEPSSPVMVVSVSLTATGAQEANKPTHYISLKNTGDVTITATLSPANADPSLITWSGGTAGADNLHRIVSTSSAADTDVTATVAGQAKSVRIHVVDAQAPPGSTSPSITFSNGGTLTPPADKFGLTSFRDPAYGVGNPTYVVNPYFSSNKWVFRLQSIAHAYKQGVHSLGRIDLPNGNPAVFPLAPGMNLTQSHTEARDDLDTSGLTSSGPRRRSYWVQFITQQHEEYHVNDFYSNTYFFNYMGIFRTQDVEDASVTVVFDCNDNTTTTGPAAITKKTPTWNTAIANRLTEAYTAYIMGAETRAYTATNPSYVPIRNAIPNP